MHEHDLSGLIDMPATFADYTNEELVSLGDEYADQLDMIDRTLDEITGGETDQEELVSYADGQWLISDRVLVLMLNALALSGNIVGIQAEQMSRLS